MRWETHVRQDETFLYHDNTGGTEPRSRGWELRVVTAELQSQVKFVLCQLSSIGKVVSAKEWKCHVSLCQDLVVRLL